MSKLILKKLLRIIVAQEKELEQLRREAWERTNHNYAEGM